MKDKLGLMDIVRENAEMIGKILQRQIKYSSRIKALEKRIEVLENNSIK